MLSKRLLRQLEQQKLTSEAVPTLEQWQLFLKSLDSLDIQKHDDPLLKETSMTASDQEMKETLAREKKMRLQLAREIEMSSIGMFAAGIVQELDGPLAGLQEYLGLMLKDGQLNEADLFRAEKILILTKRLNDISNKISKLNGKSDPLK